MTTYLLMVLLLAVIAAMALAGMRYRGNLDEFWSLDYTKTLKGVFCLIVVLVHVPVDYQNRVQDMVGSFAYIGVTFFFMASAYGLKYGYEHKKDYLSKFWRNRIAALLIPAILANAVIYAANWIVLGQTGGRLLSKLFAIDGWVQVLLLFYLFFYVVYRMFPRKKNSLLRDAVVCGLVMAVSLIDKLTPLKIVKIWPTECLGFVYGILFARYVDDVKKFAEKRNPIFGSVVLLVLSLVLGVLYLKFKTAYFIGDYVLKIILGVVILAFLFCVTSKFKIGNKVSFFLGTISYEVYIVHGAVFKLLEQVDLVMESGVYIYLSIMLTVSLATIIHFASRPMIRMVRK